MGRQGRLFLVTSTTTTSTLTTSSLCYTSNVAAVCTGKRKERHLVEDPITGAANEIEVSRPVRSDRSSKAMDIESSDEVGSVRKPRFFLYWMTTTSTSTSTSYSSTVTFGLLTCTPSNYA